MNFVAQTEGDTGYDYNDAYDDNYEEESGQVIRNHPIERSSKRGAIKFRAVHLDYVVYSKLLKWYFISLRSRTVGNVFIFDNAMLLLIYIYCTIF